MLKATIKKAMFAAMKSGDVVKKEVYRLVMGEVTMAEAKRGEDMTDAEVEKVLRKLVKGINETLTSVTDPEKKSTLEAERAALEVYLPKSLTLDDVMAALAGETEAIKAAGSDGQATGVAMKALKATGVVVDGKIVSAAVKQIRG